MKKITILLLLMVTLAFVVNNAYCTEDRRLPELKRFTMGVNGQLLQDIVEDLSIISGYKIIIDKELENEEIKGSYIDITLDEFFRRALKGKNIALEFNEQKNIVFVSFFKFSDFVEKSITKDDEAWYKKDPLSPEDLMHRKQQQQLKEFYRRKNDPDALEPMTGLRSGDLKSKQDEQLEEFKDRMEDPNSKAPMVDLSNEELRVKKAEQLAEFEARMNDPDSIDSATGSRSGDIELKQSKQLKEFEARMNDPDSIDPMTGLRRGDLQAKQAEQLADFEKRYKK